jgi:hypothetical protein
MNLFWLLALAHLIGDFPLQTDRVFYYKSNIRWGLWVHVGICTACNLLLTIPYLRYPAFWLILAGLTISHYIYDRSKIRLTDTGISDNFSLFFIDQVLHFSTVFAAALLFYHIYPAANDTTLAPWGNIKYVQLAAGFIFIVFAIAPINYFLINDYYAYFRKLKRPHWNFPTGGDRKWGYLERALVAVAVIFKSWLLILIPIALLLRLLFRQKRNLADFSLSIGLSVVFALVITRII